MTAPLPKWIMKRYAALWRRQKSKLFSFKQAVNILKEKPARVSVVLSELKKYGWLEMRLDKKDARKRSYHLQDPITAVEELT